MSTLAVPAIERPRRRQLLLQWLGDALICSVAIVPIAFAFVAASHGSPVRIEREDHWRFAAMPDNDVELSRWAAASKGLSNVVVVRSSASQLILKYGRDENRGPVRPDWESLGYSAAYLTSSQTPKANPPVPPPVWPLAAATFPVVGIVAAWRIRRLCDSNAILIRLSDCPQKGWWKCVGAGATVILPLSLVQRWAQSTFHIDTTASKAAYSPAALGHGWGLISAFLAIILFAPVAEELFFRGLLLGRFGAHQYWKSGIALSAVVFALLHADTAHIVELFGVGLVLGWLYGRTRSIWPGVLLHTLNNTAVFASIWWWNAP